MKTILQTLIVAMALSTAMLIGFQLGNATPTVVSGPFRPRPRPDPLPPVPDVPLTEDDDRLVKRLLPGLLPRIREAAAERAAAEVQQELIAASRSMDTPVQGFDLDAIETANDGRAMVQGVAGIMLAGAIAGFVKKVVIGLVTAVVGTAIIALLAQYWTWIAAGFGLAVTIVAWPAGWAAAKWAKP